MKEVTTRRGHPKCTECGKPVMCGQGRRHLSCCQTCQVCFEPVRDGHKCKQRKAGGVS